MGILVEKIEEFCNQVLTQNDDDERASLMQKMENFLKNNRKRSMEPMEDSKLRKKAKLDLVGGNTVLPYEVWLKVMNYLPTKDLFGNFALVNKSFYTLSLDPKAVKYLQLNSIMGPDEFEPVQAISCRLKHIVELSIDATYGYDEDPGTWGFIIEHFTAHNLYKSVRHRFC